MARRTHQGQFTPTNPQKYIGQNIDKINYKSSWELTTCNYLDLHPLVEAWSYECLPSRTVHSGIDGIPYTNPFFPGGKRSIYVPDFFIVYRDKKGGAHIEVMEVKPADEVPGFQGRVSKMKQARQMLNAAKWETAAKFCAQRGWNFRIVTENELFAWTRPKR